MTLGFPPLLTVSAQSNVNLHTCNSMHGSACIIILIFHRPIKLHTLHYFTHEEMEQNKCDLSHGEVEIPIIETCSSMQCFEPQKWSCYLFQFTVPLWRHNQDGHQNQSSRQHSRIHPQQSDFIVGGILLNYAEVKNILLLKSCITERGVSSVPIFHHDVLPQSGNTMTCRV